MLLLGLLIISIILVISLVISLINVSLNNIESLEMYKDCIAK